MFDYHVHTGYSQDTDVPVSAQLDAAVMAGLQEICFTDHVDFDLIVEGKPFYPPADLNALKEELRSLAPLYPSVTVKRGAEVSLSDERCAKDAHAYIKSADLDFVIGSLHVIDGIDTYTNEFYEGKTKMQAYRMYLTTLANVIRTNSYFCVMGHYDFVTKHAPYPDRSLSYSFAPNIFDDIFTYLIQSGKTLELNTSAWLNSPKWGFDVYKRFSELGGEFVTIGSDAHRTGRVGARFDEACELLRAAGIRYIATYDKMKPTMHRVP
jgi:histidinol-phosphatase (PHP family)